MIEGDPGVVEWQVDCLAFVQNHSPVHDDSGVPYDSLTVDAAQPDARLVPASGLLRTAEGRTVRFNPAGWRSVRLEADGSTTWFAKGPALLPIVPRIDKEPNVAKRGHVWMGMVKR